MVPVFVRFNLEFWVLMALSISLTLLSYAVSFLYSLSAIVRFPLGGSFVGPIALWLAVVLVGWFFFMLSIGYISELYRTYFVDDETDSIAATSPQPGQ